MKRLGLLFFLCVSCFAFKKNQRNIPKLKTTILFFNSDETYAMGIDRYLFWAEVKYHDTLTITDHNLNRLILNGFKSLKDTTLFQGSDYLRYAAAFIIEQNDKVNDTFYCSPSFHYWKDNKGRDYIDTTNFFEKTFSGFLIP